MKNYISIMLLFIISLALTSQVHVKSTKGDFNMNDLMDKLKQKKQSISEILDLAKNPSVTVQGIIGKIVMSIYKAIKAYKENIKTEIQNIINNDGICAYIVKVIRENKKSNGFDKPMIEQSTNHLKIIKESNVNLANDFNKELEKNAEASLDAVEKLKKKFEDLKYKHKFVNSFLKSDEEKEIVKNYISIQVGAYIKETGEDSSSVIKGVSDTINCVKGVCSYVKSLLTPKTRLSKINGQYLLSLIFFATLIKYFVAGVLEANGFDPALAKPILITALNIGFGFIALVSIANIFRKD